MSKTTRTPPGTRTSAPSGQDPMRTGSTSQDTQALETAAMDTPKIDRWSPANRLTMPEIDGNYVYRWIAESVNGLAVPGNVQTRLQQGWQRVHRHEVAGRMPINEDDGDGYARRPGLLLMKLPKEFARQRDEYYQNLSADRARTVHEMHGNAIPREHSVYEDRGSRALTGADAGRALHNLANNQ